MSKHDDFARSQELEKRLLQSIDAMSTNIKRSHKLKKQIIALRKQRRAIEAIPQDVKDWYEETSAFADNEGEEET